MDDREKPDQMNEFRSYVRDGAAIYAESFATLRREADLSAFSPFFSELPADYLTPENIVNRKGHSPALKR